ncbi:MAG: hypothetical protein ABH817_00590 [archaeon]
MNKRGQVTIFIIIGIAIVIIGIILFFVMRPSGTPELSKDINPNEYLSECVFGKVEPYVKLISERGGYLEPEFFIMHEKENELIKVQYLCYASGSYTNCTNQRPMLREFIEEQLIENTHATVKEKCIDKFRQYAEENGFEVQLSQFDKEDYEILTEFSQIKINLRLDITITKGTATKNFKNFEFVKDSYFGGQIIVAEEVVNDETHCYGDTKNPEEYMNRASFDSWLTMEKIRNSDGTRIYILTDRSTENEFIFAIRSCYTPGGFL